MLHVRQAPAEGSVVLEVSGTLDGVAVEALVAAALEQPLALRLVIDLSRAVIYDSALETLLDPLLLSRRLWVRGLAFHRGQPRQRPPDDPIEIAEEYAHTD
jgi:hypothetical protein